MGLTGKMLTRLRRRRALQSWCRLARSGRATPGLDRHCDRSTVEDGQALVDLDVKTTNQDGTAVVSGYAGAKVDCVAKWFRPTRSEADLVRTRYVEADLGPG